jgi:hypothetical protein
LNNPGDITVDLENTTAIRSGRRPDIDLLGHYDPMFGRRSVGLLITTNAGYLISSTTYSGDCQPGGHWWKTHYMKFADEQTIGIAGAAPF